MTEIEQKALALLKECGWGGAHLKRAWNPRYEALCRAIEQHEAFKREVSDAVEDYLAHMSPWPDNSLRRFILPKPVDPLVAVMDDFMSMDGGCLDECVKQFRAALAKSGLEVREIEG